MLDTKNAWIYLNKNFFIFFSWCGILSSVAFLDMQIQINITSEKEKPKEQEKLEKALLILDFWFFTFLPCLNKGQSLILLNPCKSYIWRHNNKWTVRSLYEHIPLK